MVIDMKSVIKMFTFLLIALITVCVVSATSNDKLPSKDEVNSVLSEMKTSSASDIFNTVKEDHPAWKVDLLECSTCSGDKEALALYYDNSSSQKGYGSIYFKEGEIVSPSNLKGYSLKEPYKGELDESGNDIEPSENNDTEKDNTTEDDKEDKIIKEDETESTSKNTYEAFQNLLDDYDGDLKSTKEEDADALSEYFTENGWDTKVYHCVEVDTSDEGTVYIVLGA